MTRAELRDVKAERDAAVAAFAVTDDERVTIHMLKTIQPYFDDVISGRKTFEVRSCADRTFAVGDLLRLREYDAEHNEYSGREADCGVLYLIAGPPYLPGGIAVMGIQLEALRDVTAERDAALHSWEPAVEQRNAATRQLDDLRAAVLAVADDLERCHLSHHFRYRK